MDDGLQGIYWECALSAQRAPDALHAARQFFKATAPVIHPIRCTHVLKPALILEFYPLVEIETFSKMEVEVIQGREPGFSNDGCTEIEQAGMLAVHQQQVILFLQVAVRNTTCMQ
jgi:hypothetical protein